jgi:hypothetical protein
MSTIKPETGLQELFTFFTVILMVNGTPVLVPMILLRDKEAGVMVGKGPAVSELATVHAAALSKPSIEGPINDMPKKPNPRFKKSDLSMCFIFIG